MKIEITHRQGTHRIAGVYPIEVGIDGGYHPYIADGAGTPPEGVRMGSVACGDWLYERVCLRAHELAIAAALARDPDADWWDGSGADEIDDVTDKLVAETVAAPGYRAAERELLGDDGADAAALHKAAHSREFVREVELEAWPIVRATEEGLPPNDIPNRVYDFYAPRLPLYPHATGKSAECGRVVWRRANGPGDVDARVLAAWRRPAGHARDEEFVRAHRESAAASAFEVVVGGSRTLREGAERVIAIAAMGAVCEVEAQPRETGESPDDFADRVHRAGVAAGRKAAGIVEARPEGAHDADILPPPPQPLPVTVAKGDIATIERRLRDAEDASSEASALANNLDEFTDAALYQRAMNAAESFESLADQCAATAEDLRTAATVEVQLCASRARGEQP